MKHVNHVEVLGKGCVTKSFWGNKRYLSAVCADDRYPGKLVLKFDFKNGYTASVLRDPSNWLCQRTGAEIWFVIPEWYVDPSESPIHVSVAYGEEVMCLTPKEVKKAINNIKKLPPRE